MNGQDRLQPSLLDRLTDQKPEEQREPRERRVLSIPQFREAVKRDLAWLLNTTNLASVQHDLSDYPLAQRSALNFGIPDLSGKVVSSMRAEDVEQTIKQAILDYEPRILPQSLRVRVIVDPEKMSHNALRFEIEGELWCEPAPLHLVLQTVIDLESGHARIEEGGRRGSV